MPDGLPTDQDLSVARVQLAVDRHPCEQAEVAQRGDTILALARQAFVEKGFDGASMQDLARAAGMSAGNFYRYFPSKAALIEAMIARDCGDIEGHFAAIAAAPDPMAAMKAGLREHMAADDREEDALWAEITAAAARKPELAQGLRRMEDRIVGHIVQVLGLVHGVPADEALRRFGTHGRLVFMIIHGAMTGTGGRPMDCALADLMMRTIDGLLDDALTLGPGE